MIMQKTDMGFDLKQELQDLLPGTAENADIEINKEISDVSEIDFFFFQDWDQNCIMQILLAVAQ